MSISLGSFPTGQGHVSPADPIPPPPPVNPENDLNAMQNMDNTTNLPYQPSSFAAPSYVPTCGEAPVANTQRLEQRLDSRQLVPMTKMINTIQYPTEYKYAPSPNDKEVKMGD
ncbi:hypothetical protein L218DRAFT_78225 [Marasmius fiardii PR-910]|nr:hypothetical protein L218DRAFT_78225 [Marasmius fiardii PR-910]